MSTDGARPQPTAQAAPAVPQAATPDPETPPKPGVPTMNLLETDVRAIMGSGGQHEGAVRFETKEGDSEA